LLGEHLGSDLEPGGVDLLLDPLVIRGPDAVAQITDALLQLRPVIPRRGGTAADVRTILLERHRTPSGRSVRRD
jgi:hypothetical protein